MNELCTESLYEVQTDKIEIKCGIVVNEGELWVCYGKFIYVYDL